MTEQDIAEQAYNNGYNQAIKDTAYKIECLQEENKILKSPKYGRWKVKFFNARDEIAELQKQVDELKEENTELYKEHTTVIAGSILQKKQAVEDTAKEITSKVFDLNISCGDDFRLFLYNFELWVKERYGVEVE